MVYLRLLTGLCAVLLTATLALAAPPSITLWSVEEKTTVMDTDAVNILAQKDFVYIGEVHDNFTHHEGQLAVIAALHEAGKEVAVGLEMIQHGDQKLLDAWVAGELSEFRMQAVFWQNWGDMWPYYRDIFRYCRENRVPMVALNVPREIVRKVARFGFEALTDKEIGKLPVVTCNVDPEYKELLRRSMTMHHAHGSMDGMGGDAAFERFCEAQVVWDTNMAVYATDYKKAHPDTTMVVMTGMVHAWKKAIPEQVSRIDADARQATIFPLIPGRVERANASPDETDYLLVDFTLPRSN